MIDYRAQGKARLYQGDMREVLAAKPAESADAAVCDPPYGLEFMGKGWDKGVPGPEFWVEVLRTLKPGGHLLAFGGTRTHHRLWCAIEDAGFELRDTIMWLYGTGFPKSLDVSKAIDKAAGAEREVGDVKGTTGGGRTAMNDAPGYGRARDYLQGDYYSTAPATDAAREWEGWGTALKPAWEPILLARKPLEGTVAANILAHGTGALNIDASRIGTDENLGGGAYAKAGTDRSEGYENWRYKRTGDAGKFQQPTGRWPANVILDEEAGAMLDEQTGDLGTGGGKQLGSKQGAASIYGNQMIPGVQDSRPQPDSGGASRFFYCSKASRAERELGLEELEPVSGAEAVDRKPDTAGMESPRAGAGRTAKEVKNHHPTVKPLALMRYLVRLVTPSGGVVLDPFCGSGSTLVAAIQEGFRPVGIDLDEAYCEIAWKRVLHEISDPLEN